MAEVAERIYFGAPIWAQQLMVAVYGWRWYHRRFGRHFDRLMAEFYAREHWTRHQFNAYQEEHLGKILAAAWRAPYYRRVFGERGLTLDSAPFDMLRRLPILSKETLRTRPRDLLTENRVPREATIFRSSGTTGTPTDIYYMPEFHALELAVPAARNLGWAGISHRARRVMFGVRKVCHFDQSKPPFWRFSPVENMAYASIYHLSARFLPYYLEFLRSYQPVIIMGYPSSLHTLACFFLENDDLPPPAKAIFTTSETVTSKAREAIEAAWRCRIYDRYGAVEGCMFASQCENDRYHVSPEVGIIEIIDHNGEPAPAGKVGEVICTGLQNALQPLVRYQTGDVASWSVEQNCPCGRHMPILENIGGRIEDVCYTPDGREVVRFDTVFKGITHIRQAQVVQEKSCSFTVYVVPAPGFNGSDIERIQKNMRLHVGRVQTEVRAVDSLMCGASGKFRAVVCRLSSEEKRLMRRSGINVNTP